jgi:hypothetical protein
VNRIRAIAAILTAFSRRVDMREAEHDWTVRATGRSPIRGGDSDSSGGFLLAATERLPREQRRGGDPST